MAISLVNSKGKELKLPAKAAKEFFASPDGVTRILCIPCSEIVHADAAISTLYEIKEVRRKKKVDGVCVIRMGGIGDLIMLSSGLREMVRRGNTLTLATLSQHIPFMKSLGICNVMSIDNIGKYEFDKFIDLRFAVEPKEMGSICKSDWTSYTMKDRSDVFDELLGIYPARKNFTIPVSDTKMASVLKKLGSNAGIILINVAIGAIARSIIPKYVEPLCKKIIKATGRTVVLIGQSQTWNKELTQIATPSLINLIDATDIGDVVALCSLADMVITPDTGTTHIAASLGKKTLALFGNINPRTRTSYYKTVRALYPQGELSCHPCWDLHPCMNEAAYGTKCMKLLDPDRIVNAALEWGC
jgi:ADP-heptose:LPS heptosyltransferase